MSFAIKLLLSAGAATLLGASSLVLAAPVTPRPKPKPGPAEPARPARSVTATPIPATNPSGPSGTPLPAPRFKTGLGLADIPDPGQDVKSREAQRLNRLASGEFNQGNLAQAREHFDSALKLAPGNPSILINLGLLAYRQRDYTQAELHLRRVLRSQPESGLAWLILGVIYYDQDKLDGALAALAQAALYEPKDARVHHYLGVTIGKKGWYLGAEDEMRKAIELQPDYAEAHFNLSVFYLQRNPPAVELARRHYLKARSLGAEPDLQVEKGLEP
jgi:Flp pilus assembly protein TadD